MPLRLVLAGWVAVVLFAGVVVAYHGLEAGEAGFAALLATVGVGMGLWVYRRRSRASLVASLVLGPLHSVEQLAYSVATLTAEPVDAALAAADLFGLAGAVLIVAGAGMALRGQRSAISAVARG